MACRGTALHHVRTYLKLIDNAAGLSSTPLWTSHMSAGQHVPQLRAKAQRGAALHIACAVTAWVDGCVAFCSQIDTYSGRKITESLGNVTVRGEKDGKSKGGARLSTVCLSMYSITENIYYSQLSSVAILL
jgi:hypothetical protein